MSKLLKSDREVRERTAEDTGLLNPATDPDSKGELDEAELSRAGLVTNPLNNYFFERSVIK